MDCRRGGSVGINGYWNGDAIRGGIEAEVNETHGDTLQAGLEQSTGHLSPKQPSDKTLYVTKRKKERTQKKDDWTEQRLLQHTHTHWMMELDDDITKFNNEMPSAEN